MSHRQIEKPGRVMAIMEQLANDMNVSLDFGRAIAPVFSDGPTRAKLCVKACEGFSDFELAYGLPLLARIAKLRERRDELTRALEDVVGAGTHKMQTPGSPAMAYDVSYVEWDAFERAVEVLGEGA
jgi:hypothetical protein